MMMETISTAIMKPHCVDNHVWHTAPQRAVADLQLRRIKHERRNTFDIYPPKANQQWDSGLDYMNQEGAALQDVN